MTRFALLVSTCVIAVAVSGCLKSLTSEASSESSSNSSGSSSDSSSPEAAFERDVAEATRGWTLGGGDTEALQKDIGRLATEGGISDWENLEATWQGIGRGLARAGVVGDRFASVSQQIGGGDPQRMAWIKAGYEDE